MGALAPRWPGGQTLWRVYSCCQRWRRSTTGSPLPTWLPPAGQGQRCCSETMLSMTWLCSGSNQEQRLPTDSTSGKMVLGKCSTSCKMVLGKCSTSGKMVLCKCSTSGKMVLCKCFTSGKMVLGNCSSEVKWYSVSALRQSGCYSISALRQAK